MIQTYLSTFYLRVCYIYVILFSVRKSLIFLSFYLFYFSSPRAQKSVNQRLLDLFFSNYINHKSFVLKSRDDFDFRDNIQRGPIASTYNGLQIENGGRDGTRMRILRRPPFDFVAVKRIHAYLAPRRPSRSLLRVQLFLAGMQPSHLENEKHKSSCSFAKRTFGRESARTSARAQKGAAVLCKFMRPRGPRASRRRRRPTTIQLGY